MESREELFSSTDQRTKTDVEKSRACSETRGASKACCTGEASTRSETGEACYAGEKTCCESETCRAAG